MNAGEHVPSRVAFPERGVVIEALRAAGNFGSAETLEFVDLPRNPARIDFLCKHAFRVLRSGRPWCFLTVGRDLADLWRRTCNLAEACPAITCRPLFFRTAGDWDLFGVDVCSGSSLEARHAVKRLTRDEAIAAASAIRRGLAGTAELSSPQAAVQELDALGSRALASPWIPEHARIHLRDTVLPWMREDVLRSPAQSRWSNGDFVARNILLADDGAVRLIDHEFAARTHFPQSDRWRWTTFSLLPAEWLSAAWPDEGDPGAARAEAFAILQHLVLAEEIHPPEIVSAEFRARLPRLFQVAEQALRGAGASRCVINVPAQQPTPTHDAAANREFAQLFWHATGAFVEHESMRVGFARGVETTLAYLIPRASGDLQLRLDPAESPGNVELARVQVRRLRGLETSHTLDIASGWEQIHLVRGLVRVASDVALHLQSLDQDPSLLLPTVHVGSEPCDILIEITLRFERASPVTPDAVPLQSPSAASAPLPASSLRGSTPPTHA